MNIFVVNSDPKIAAQELCDKHVVKMVLESAQMLSTNAWELGVEGPYKKNHLNHPCTIWARQTESNWLWLLEHGLELSAEYTRRYDKTHKSLRVLLWAQEHSPRPPAGELTPFAQCMPDQYRQADAVLAYQEFYRQEKKAFACWAKSHRGEPVWWKEF